MKRFVVVTLVALAVVLLVPFPTLVAPEWTVHVYDGARPVQGALVREEYQNYSLESTAHESDAITNSSGEVIFPARRKYASLLQRAFGVVRAAAMGGVHAGFGPHSYVMAFKEGWSGMWQNGGFVGDWTGSPRRLDSAIILHPDSASR